MLWLNGPAVVSMGNCAALDARRADAVAITAATSSLGSLPSNPRPRVYALAIVVTIGMTVGTRSPLSSSSATTASVDLGHGPLRRRQQRDSLRLQQCGVPTGYDADTDAVVVAPRLIEDLDFGVDIPCDDDLGEVDRGDTGLAGCCTPVFVM